MKRLYTEIEYKQKHRRKLKKRLLAITNKNKSKKHTETKEPASNGPRIKKQRPRPYTPKQEIIKHKTVKAPNNFKFIDNTEEVLKFIANLNNSSNYRSNKKREKYLVASLKNIVAIDYAAISIFTATMRKLSGQQVYVRGDFPANKEARKVLTGSGFFEYVHIKNSKKSEFSHPSKLVFFKKGEGKLTQKHNMEIGEDLKDINKQLSGNRLHLKNIKSVILEICGNSLEWADSFNNQWLLGIDREEDYVIFTATDLGKGILKDLRRKFSDKVIDLINNDVTILNKAFEKQYESNSKEGNRNKGLPKIKEAFDNNNISSLIVVTNKVILNFDKNSEPKSRELKSEFHGTFYQWKLTKDNELT